MKNKLNGLLGSKVFLMDDGEINAKAELAALSIMAAMENDKVILVDSDEIQKPMIIEINGIKYQKIEQAKPSKSKLLELATPYMLAGMYMGGGGGAPRKRPAVDLETEFELIQNKKSTLSRNDREWVVFQFNKIYKIV